MLNAFTVDLESWFCSHHFAGQVPYKRWASQDLRLQAPTQRLLKLLARHDVRATFFVVGWVAEQAPQLIEQLADAGHEIASHGYRHKLVNSMFPADFDEDLERSIDVLHKISGQDITGFRAPAFSINDSCSWALDRMRAHGILFDSSLHPPAALRQISYTDTPFNIHRRSNGIIELPPSCVRLAGKTVACGGGGFFRLYPYQIFRWMLRRCNSEGRPIVFYIHPWELDARISAHLPQQVRGHRAFVNIHKVEARLERLLQDFEFGSVQDVLIQGQSAGKVKTCAH